MKINHMAPLYPTGPDVDRAFSEIVNIILMSCNIMELNRLLIMRNMNIAYGSLSGHFHWSFRFDCFTVWQRTGYNHPTCFPQRTIMMRYPEIAAADREIDSISLN